MYLFLGAMMRVAEEVAGDGSNSLSQEDRDTLHALASRILKQSLRLRILKSRILKIRCKLIQEVIFLKI